MSKFRKFLSFLLSACLVAGIFGSMAIYADDAEMNGTEALEAVGTSENWNIQEGGIKTPEYVYVSEGSSVDGVAESDPSISSDSTPTLEEQLTLLQETSTAIRAALLNGSTQVSLSAEEFALLQDTTSQYINIQYYCPYFDGVNLIGNKYGYATQGSTVNYYLTITNNLTQEETTAWVNEIDAKLDALMDLISDTSLTAADQALILHDYLAAHDHYSTTIVTQSYYPSFMLTKNEGVCQAYAYLFQYLMNKKGNDCYFVSSEEMNHGWNMLKIGDNYYHIDITWDDPTPDQYGMAQHDFFLLSGDTMGSKTTSSGEYHHDWDLTYTCSDASYEDDYFITSTSPVVMDGTLRYYIEQTTGNEYNYTVLECYDTSTGTRSRIDDLGYWYVLGSTTSYNPGNYSGLLENQGKLFYNTYNAIKTYDLETREVAVYALPDTSTEHIYGCVLKDGKLCYSLQTSADVAYNEKNIVEILALIGTTPYETLTAAMSGAASGNTITLAADSGTTSDEYQFKDVTLDLKGFDLTAAYVALMGSGSIIDTGDSLGSLIIASDLLATNGATDSELQYLPVYSDSASAYYFVKFTPAAQWDAVNTNKLWFNLGTADTKVFELLKKDSTITIGFHLYYAVGDRSCNMKFYVPSTLVATYLEAKTVGNSGVFSATFTGTDGMTFQYAKPFGCSHANFYRYGAESNHS